MADSKFAEAGDGVPLVAKVVLGVFFSVLVGVAYFIVFFGEVQDGIEAEGRNIEAKKVELKDKEKILAAYNKDLTELEQRRLLEEKQRKILPDKAQTTEFLAALQSVAKGSGVSIVSWNPQDEIREKFYAKVPMELKLRGQFHQVSRFFFGVGQVDRIINVQSISIDIDPKSKTDDPEEAESRETLVDVQCMATAFRTLSKEETTDKKKKKRGRR
ncbi:MAG: type 4a pilus biogenesis protein PilO [Myxococcota bacterium]